MTIRAGRQAGLAVDDSLQAALKVGTQKIRDPMGGQISDRVPASEKGREKNTFKSIS